MSQDQPMDEDDYEPLPPRRIDSYQQQHRSSSSSASSSECKVLVSNLQPSVTADDIVVRRIVLYSLTLQKVAGDSNDLMLCNLMIFRNCSETSDSWLQQGCLPQVKQKLHTQERLMLSKPLRLTIIGTQLRNAVDFYL
jgi:hypothetical protein